jgi:hypothetical protein
MLCSQVIKDSLSVSHGRRTTRTARITPHHSTGLLGTQHQLRQSELSRWACVVLAAFMLVLLPISLASVFSSASPPRAVLLHIALSPRAGGLGLQLLPLHKLGCWPPLPLASACRPCSDCSAPLRRPACCLLAHLHSDELLLTYLTACLCAPPPMQANSLA